MKKLILGKAGIEVTELCFGALPMGPLQKNMAPEKSAEVLTEALKRGVNFVDTAESYRTYEPIRLAMEWTGIRPVIASKSNKKTYEGMKSAVEDALENLGIDYIDIFHIHAAREGEGAFEIYKDSIRCLVDMKRAGKIKAVGISTHSIAVTRKAAKVDEIDVVFPIINLTGRGIIDGSKEEMVEAIGEAFRAGKGIYFMKALAGGSLIGDYHRAMKFVRAIDGCGAVAVGMVSQEEVEFNVRYFDGEDIDSIPDTVKSSKRVIVVKSLCKGCGTCITACPNNAISIGQDNLAFIDDSKCLTCGYCTPVCPQFAIRFV